MCARLCCVCIFFFYFYFFSLFSFMVPLLVAVESIVVLALSHTLTRLHSQSLTLSLACSLTRLHSRSLTLSHTPILSHSFSLLSRSRSRFCRLLSHLFDSAAKPSAIPGEPVCVVVVVSVWLLL